MQRDLQLDAKEFEGQMMRFVREWEGEREKALLGLAASHFRAMTVMRERGAMTMGDVARALGATLGGATGFVDRMVRSGLAVREFDPSDRRIVRVRLTTEGNQTSERVTRDMVAYARRILSGLADDERARLLELWAKVIQGLTEDPAQAASQ